MTAGLLLLPRTQDDAELSTSCRTYKFHSQAIMDALHDPVPTANGPAVS